MNADIIIGANYGDEGKGTVTATCAKHMKGETLNILTNGGAQRAHSVLTDKGNITFQHFGSGTCHGEGTATYFSSYFILNPMQFAKESNELLYKGIRPVVYRDIHCRWSTPYDMMANAIIEKLRGPEKHGSCGMGIWETILRYMNSVYTKSFDCFISMDFDEQLRYLSDIKEYYEMERLCNMIPDEWKYVWNNYNMMVHFINDCQFMYNNTYSRRNLSEILNSNISHFNNLIFENGQGLMLSDTGKDLPGTTPSLTGCDYAKAIIEETGIDMDVRLHYVTRTYLTRHGRGFLNNESERTVISGYINEDRTNHYNEFQEFFRYGKMTNDIMVRMHDYIMEDASKMKNATVILDVTHCDEVDNVSEFKKLFANVNTYDSPLIK